MARPVYYVAGWREEEDLWVAHVYACSDEDGNRALLAIATAQLDHLENRVRDLIATLIQVSAETFDIRLTLLPSPHDPPPPDGGLPLYMRVGSGSELLVGHFGPSHKQLANLLRDAAWEIEAQQSTSEEHR